MKIRIVSSSPSTRPSKEASCCNHPTINLATKNQRTKYYTSTVPCNLCVALAGGSWFYGILKKFSSFSHKPVSCTHTISFKTSQVSVPAWATCTICCFLWPLPWDPRSACNQKAKFMYRSAYGLYLPYLFLNSLNDKSNRSTTETASEKFVSSKVIGKPECHHWQICCLIYVCEIPFINISRQGLYLMQSCKFLA